MSGADVEMVARNAKRLVRRGDSALTADQLIASMPAVRRIRDDELKRNALHESGHAVIGVKATDLATIVECQLGMGFTLTSEVGERPRDLRTMRQLNCIAWRQIDETVRVQFERAKSIVADLRSEVEDVAAKLLARKRLSGDEVRAVVASVGTPPRLQ